MAHTIGTMNRIPAGDTTTYSTSDPVTGSLLPTSGATLLVATILYSGGADRTGGAPTFGDNTMIQADTARRGNTSPEVSTEMWYLTASAISSASITGSWVSVPNGGGVRVVVNLMSALAKPGTTSVLQVTTGSANTGATTNPYCKITTTAGSTIIFESVADGANTWAPTGRTLNWVNVNDNDIGVYGGGTQYFITDTIGVITGSWTFGTGEDWGVVMTAFGEGAITLIVSNAVQAQTSPLIDLIQNYKIIVDNVVQTQTADDVGLIQIYSILPQDDQQLQTSDNLILTGHGPTDSAIPDNVIQIQISDNIQLKQNYVLETYNVQQIQTGDNIFLTQNYILTIQNTTQTQTSENITLTLRYILTLQDTIQSQTCQNVFITGYIGIIAEIDHETGNTSQYDYISDAHGDFTVTTAARLAGTSYGLSCRINDTSEFYGTKRFPTTPLIRYRLYVDINSLSMINGDSFEFCSINQFGGDWKYYSLLFIEREAGNYRLGIDYADDNGWKGYSRSIVTDEPHYIEVQVKRALTDTSADGEYSWWIDGVLKNTFSGIDNYHLLTNAPITEFRVGAMYGIADDTTNGTYYVDEIVIRGDTTEIGPNIYVPVQNTTQIQTSDNISLIQNYILAVMIAAHLQTSGNITFGGGGVMKQMIHYMKLRRR